MRKEESMENERIAIVSGIRTPMSKVGGPLKGMQADDLGSHVVKHVATHSHVSMELIDEVIIGNVAHPAHAANIARVIALKAGFHQSMSAYTVHRNCGSGMESIISAANQIWAGESAIVIAGGTESMSNIPLFLSDPMKDILEKLMSAKSPLQKLKILSKMRPRYLKPVIGVVLGLTDPVCGLNMGQTAEVLAKEFHISREEQDAFALRSHQYAVMAIESGHMAEEILPLPVAPTYRHVMEKDNGPRDEQSMQQLEKLRPYFDRLNGTVTVGNACPLTDGAAAVMVMKESKAKELKLKPLGYLRGYAYAGLEPERMGLGPVYATAKLLEKIGLEIKDFSVVEINEAFAAQVLACLKAFDSKKFAMTYLSRSTSLGAIDESILNVNGGAIALGHPVGMTGTRLVITVLNELRRRKKNLGLATLCIGGGQGAAMALEVDA